MCASSSRHAAEMCRGWPRCSSATIPPRRSTSPASADRPRRWGCAPSTTASAATPQDELLELIASLNDDETVDGILVQLPLPEQIDQDEVIAAIDLAKDVDGLTAANAGLLAQGRPGLVPCTPRGVLELLRHAGTEIDGAEAVVLGRSILVGRPLAALLLGADTTVTVCHSHTRDLTAVCSRATSSSPPSARRDWWGRR